MSYMERFLVVVVKSLHRFLESTAYKVSFFWNRERKQPFSFGGGGDTTQCFLWGEHCVTSQKQLTTGHKDCEKHKLDHGGRKNQ